VGRCMDAYLYRSTFEEYLDRHFKNVIVKFNCEHIVVHVEEVRRCL
jgi:hypothetical protein